MRGKNARQIVTHCVLKMPQPEVIAVRAGNSSSNCHGSVMYRTETPPAIGAYLNVRFIWRKTAKFMRLTEDLNWGTE
jgi:hypothetical protein